MSRPIFRRLSVCAALLLCWSGLALAQDHADYDPADIEYGLSVYRAQCVTCHGDSGDGIAGVNLRSGQFRRAVSDRDLRALIANGIPDTGMLAFDLDSAEMTGIIAFLRNPNFELDAVTLGDEARGRTIFEGKGDCLSCHRVGQEGPRGSVDLTSIGTTRAPSALRRSLLDPTGTMRPIDRPVEIVTDDGERFDGRRLNEDTYTVQIIDDQGRLRSFDKDRLQQFTVHTESPMPSYGDELDDQELADVLAYLVSLKR